MQDVCYNILLNVKWAFCIRFAPRKGAVNMRILHTGDLHLDSPFSGLDISHAEKRRRELRETFSRMMRYARDEKLDMVVIAGDLFDSAFVTRETVALLVKEFSSLECPVVIAPGNHDPFVKGGIWEKTAFPKNVYIFKENSISSFEFEKLGCVVYGYAFTRTNENECLVKGVVNDPDKINILVAHGDTVSPISTYAPLPLAALRSFGADYCALGHIHNTEAANESLVNIGAYCGCPEGRDFGELGEKGALVVTVDKEGSPDVSFVRFSKRAYIVRTLNVDGAADAVAVNSAIDACIRECSDGGENLVRITLTGSVSPELVLSTDALCENTRGLFHLEIEDATSPTWNAEGLSTDPGIRGELYRTLLPRLESENEEDRKCAATALRYALAALAGEDISEL